MCKKQMKHNMLSSIKHKSHKHDPFSLFKIIGWCTHICFSFLFHVVHCSIDQSFSGRDKVYHLFIDWRTRVRCFNSCSRRNRYARFDTSRFAFNLESWRKRKRSWNCFRFQSASPASTAVIQMRERLAGWVGVIITAIAIITTKQN